MIPFYLLEETVTDMDLWKEVAEQVPALVVLGWVVYTFLKHIDTSKEDLREVTKSFQQTTEASIKALQENTTALVELKGHVKETRATMSETKEFIITAAEKIRNGG